MAQDRQKRKPFLSADRTFLTVDCQNMSFRIERFQTVRPLVFLTIKKHGLNPPPQRVDTAQAEAAELASHFKDRREAKISKETVCNLHANSATCEIAACDDRSDGRTAFREEIRFRPSNRPKSKPKAPRKGETPSRRVQWPKQVIARLWAFLQEIGTEGSLTCRSTVTCERKLILISLEMAEQL